MYIVKKSGKMRGGVPPAPWRLGILNTIRLTTVTASPGYPNPPEGPELPDTTKLTQDKEVHPLASPAIGMVQFFQPRTTPPTCLCLVSPG